MISQLMKDLIEEANGLLILKRGDGFSPEDIETIIEDMTIEDMQDVVYSLKRDEVIDLIIATEGE